jgi:hypothetical protein
MDDEEREREEREAIERNRADRQKEAEKIAQKRKPEVKSPIDLPDLPDSSDIRDLALAVEPEIFKTYYSLMMDPEVAAATRKACCDALLDRAKGRPQQEVTQKIEVEHVDVSMEEVARMMLHAQRDAVERGLDLKVIDAEVEDISE